MLTSRSLSSGAAFLTYSPLGAKRIANPLRLHAGRGSAIVTDDIETDGEIAILGMSCKKQACGTRELFLLADPHCVSGPGSGTTLPASDLNEYQCPLVAHHKVDFPVAVACVARDEDQSFGFEPQECLTLGRLA